jgi:hypothetical protein
MESWGPAGRDDAERILGLLAEPERMRVAAALVLGYSSIDEIARISGVPARSVNGAIARLVAGDMVVEDGTSGYRFAIEELKVAARSAAAARPKEEDIDAPADAARVLRAFIRDGRLTSIPAAHAKRLVILDYLSQVFEPGRHYKEKQVNEILGRVYGDVAALRRYMVDEGFMNRRGGIYWRAGGSFEVD